MNMIDKVWRQLNIHYLLLVICIIFGSWLRLIHISNQSLWLDELFTVVDTKPGITLAQLWKQFTTDAHPVFYFFIEWVWLKIVGVGDVKARIPSAVFGIAGIPAIYYCGRCIFNKEVGLAAAALLAINSYHIEYSQEARSYTLMFFLSTLSFSFLYQLIRNLKIGKGILIAWIFIQILILYTHYFGIFIFIVQTLIVILLRHKTILQFDKYFIGILLLVFGVPTILFLPMYPTLIFLSKYLSANEQTKTDVIFTYILDFFGNNFVLNFLLLTVFLYVFYFLFLCSKANDEVKLGLAFVLLWLVLGIFIPYYKSYLQSARFHIRYYTAIYPSILLIFAFVVCQIDSRKLKNVFLASTIIFLTLYHLFDREYYSRPTKSDWRSVGKFISENRTGNYAIRDISPKDDSLKLKYGDVYCYYSNYYKSPEKPIKSENFFDSNLDGIWLIYTWWMPEHNDFIPQLEANGFKLKLESPAYFGCRCVLYAKDK